MAVVDVLRTLALVAALPLAAGLTIDADREFHVPQQQQQQQQLLLQDVRLIEQERAELERQQVLLIRQRAELRKEQQQLELLQLQQQRLQPQQQPMPSQPPPQQNQNQHQMLLQQPISEQDSHMEDSHVAPAPDPFALGTYKLRLCNAYAWDKPLEMSRVEEPQLVEYPLPYKACHDYLLPLREGDDLHFRAGNEQIGTFAVRALPSDEGSLLLLVPHRRDSSSMAVVFESHIFHSSRTAQVAIVDAYRGRDHSTISVQENNKRRESLQFGTVVSLSPGIYDFALSGIKQSAERKARMAVDSAQVSAGKADATKFVVLRVGLGEAGFPEELVSFPLRSGASRAAAWMALASLVAWWLL